MANQQFEERKATLLKRQEEIIARKNERLYSENDIYHRYRYPILTRDHVPLHWRYDVNPQTNPLFM